MIRIRRDKSGCNIKDNQDVIMRKQLGDFNFLSLRGKLETELGNQSCWDREESQGSKSIHKVELMEYFYQLDVKEKGKAKR